MVAKTAGFCFGVKRAVDIAFKLAKETGEGVYTFGPIIHNPQVVKELEEEGVSSIANLHSTKINTLIIRTHGVSPAVYDEISGTDCKVVDATCPFVKKTQQYAQTLNKEGYQVIILGDREHPEVQSLQGFAGNNVITVNSSDQLPTLRRRVGIIVQTTQPLEALEKLVHKVMRSAREVKVYNTICDSTSQRQNETRKLASRVDLMIIAGGKNSANTARLAKLSREICDRVYHIETADDIQGEWFTGVETVGLTGGASTPQWIIDEAVKKLKEISFKR